MKHVVIGICEQVDGNISRYLLISSKKDYGSFTGYYYPPGGHVEAGEDEKSALQREFKEELNLLITPTIKLATTDADVPDQQTHWWKCEGDFSKLTLNSSELRDYCWMSREEIVQATEVWPSTQNFFKMYIS